MIALVTRPVNSHREVDFVRCWSALVFLLVIGLLIANWAVGWNV